MSTDELRAGSGPARTEDNAGMVAEDAAIVFENSFAAVPRLAATGVPASGMGGEFKLSDYTTKSTDDDWDYKVPLVAFVFIVLLYPIVFILVLWSVSDPRWFGDWPTLVAFGLGALLVIGANWLIGNNLIRERLQPAHEKWSQATVKIGSFDKKKSCDGVRDTLHSFRYLLKWRRFVKLIGVPFSVGYYLLVVCAGALAGALTIDWLLSGMPSAFGPVSAAAFGYYLILLGVRSSLRREILAQTEGIDPTFQICSALADIYDTLDKALTGKK